jgi:NAD(P)-dependent dehydrogenase (short-subunit alcohol dehydrogenase family)
MKQLTWLVTGCSSGFGEAFVRDILVREDCVIATRRNAPERLANLEELGDAILYLDVTTSGAEPGSKAQEVIKIL